MTKSYKNAYYSRISLHHSHISGVIPNVSVDNNCQIDKIIHGCAHYIVYNKGLNPNPTVINATSLFGIFINLN